MNNFGLTTVRSIELFHDEVTGWSFRGFSANDCTGDTGENVQIFGDDLLSCAVLSSLPALLNHLSLKTVRQGAIYPASHSVSFNVVPSAEGHTATLEVEAVSLLFETEARWALEGIGSTTPGAP